MKIMTVLNKFKRKKLKSAKKVYVNIIIAKKKQVPLKRIFWVIKTSFHNS